MYITTCKHHGRLTKSDCYKTKEYEKIRYRCKKCNVNAVLRRAKEIKDSVIQLEGGKCILCGYNKSRRALHFHHLDPKIKEFGLCAKTMRTVSWLRVLKELDKCILVCANCHSEIEDGLIKIELIRDSLTR